MNENEKILALRKALDQADAVIIGAGAGLSTSAGFAYSGARMETYFPDFVRKYHFQDMYTAGFFPFRTPEEQWAFWSRHIYINRYMDPPKPVYENLLSLVREKDYFVLTTNVDHCFQKAGFDKARLFYTQGDYGLWQCSAPCHKLTYDNAATVREMVLAQGYTIAPDGRLKAPKPDALKMAVPTELVPRCPRCGRPMSMNLRADDTFVEDSGWHAAAQRYQDFLKTHQKKVLLLEIGVGRNTPGIIKYPFWRITHQWPDATYACLSYDEAYAPREIEPKSICIEADAGETIERLLNA